MKNETGTSIEHKCIVGLLYDFDNKYLATYEMLKRESRSELTVYSLSDYLDREKFTNLYHFNFCPVCGKKIDWSALRNENY